MIGNIKGQIFLQLCHVHHKDQHIKRKSYSFNIHSALTLCTSPRLKVCSKSKRYGNSNPAALIAVAVAVALIF